MVKTPDELALMRVSGRLLASVFEKLVKLNGDYGAPWVEACKLVAKYV